MCQQVYIPSSLKISQVYQILLVYLRNIPYLVDNVSVRWIKKLLVIIGNNLLKVPQIFIEVYREF